MRAHENITVPIYIGTSWSIQGLHNCGTLGAFGAVSSKHRWLEVHGHKECEHYEHYYKPSVFRASTSTKDHPG